MSASLASLLHSPQRPRILVLGDVMLDRYLFGDVERISPEAPIPVLRVAREEYRLGGAANVAAMLAALDAEVILAGVVGDDAESQILRERLEATGVGCQAVLTDPSRPTSIKQRVLGRCEQRTPQQMMRIDCESDRPLDATLVRALIESIGPCLESLDLILVSDYGKGVCVGECVPLVLAAAAIVEVPVLADPARKTDYHRYAGCACITPNRTEAAQATGMRIATPADGLDAARQLLQVGVSAAAVTLDRDGIAWADAAGNAELFPARPRQVCDVTGAGDMVLAALGYALAAGADYHTAIELANLAGGMEVERLGVVPLTREDLLDELARTGGATSHKIVTLDELLAQLDRQRQAGRRIVMTNGCFDLLHPGHVASLAAARQQGDCLVVGLNSDRSVEALKGPGRPIIGVEGRAEMLAALACVDWVVVFDDLSVAGLVERVRPDVLVKAAEYRVEQIVGHELLQRHGGRVVPVPMRDGYSTSGLIERCASACREERNRPTAEGSLPR
jgi:D-beta-D-heptose 7-phosphate kinase/D-beta-D-heptose 1-phosphate adenosyltransferase